MNQPKQPTNLDQGREWLDRAVDAFFKGHLDNARIAAMLGSGFVALAHAERSAKSSAKLDAAAERVRRAAAEARPHDDELGPHCTVEGQRSCPICTPEPDDTVPPSCTFVHQGQRCVFSPDHETLTSIWFHQLPDGSKVDQAGERLVETPEADRG